MFLAGEAEGVDEDAEAGGVGVRDAGHVDGHVGGSLLDGGLDLLIGGFEPGAEGERSDQGDDHGLCIDVAEGDLKRHGCHCTMLGGRVPMARRGYGMRADMGLRAGEVRVANGAFPWSDGVSRGAAAETYN